MATTEDETRARARNTDPASSHIAAAEANTTGRAKRQRAQAYNAVYEHDGLTCRELARHMASDQIGVLKKNELLHRRLPELREDGQIKNGKHLRICTVTKRRAVTWWLVRPRPDKQMDFFDDGVRT
jgi:hypothetical protein